MKSPNLSCNSGQTLWGAEYLAWNYYGRNNMCTQCAASLMLEVTQAGLQKHNFPAENPYFARTKYFRGLLSNQPWSDETSVGYGVPPGTTLRNKIGGKIHFLLTPLVKRSTHVLSLSASG